MFIYISANFGAVKGNGPCIIETKFLICLFTYSPTEAAFFPHIEGLHPGSEHKSGEFLSAKWQVQGKHSLCTKHV